MSTAQLGRVPFLPEITLRAYNVYEPGDDRFRAAARMRQALLRQERGWPVGVWAPESKKARELGSYLSERHDDFNFITPEIAKLARREVAWREDDALIETDRLYRNLLTSAAATFNMLGPLALDLRLASAVMRRIAPDLAKKAIAAKFEHSPARRNSAFTNDRTAFDAFFNIRTFNGEHGFIACEVKYTETMTEAPARLRPTYDEVSRECELFVNPDDPALRTAPLNQLWRQHMLAFTMVRNGLYSIGRFMVIVPSLNRAAQQAIALYRNHLLPGGTVPFEVITYERLIEAIRRSGANEIADLLHERYLDFSSVDELITG